METARQGPDTRSCDERKIDQVVSELNRYNVKIASLQETRWFGNDVYDVDGSLVLTAGRPVPDAGRVRQRGEGVAIVHADEAANAWRTGGKRWKAWSSRLVTAVLKTGRNNLHVMSCYAPTFAATREEKEAFFTTLQLALDEIPINDQYVMMGDFNARIGFRKREDSCSVRGPHGIGVANDAGKEFLSFLGINEATVCNTWFKKRNIHKQTWQHPKSNKWHCIDYIIVRQDHRRKCLDTMVMRGAECNTDHQLRRMKWLINTNRKHWSRGRKRPTGAMGRFDVSKLLTRDDHGKETREEFQRLVCERAKDPLVDSTDIESKWLAVKTALCDAAGKGMQETPRLVQRKG